MTSEKKHISKQQKIWRKIIRVFLWVAILVYLVAVFGFVAEKSSGIVCRDIRVIIIDSSENAFIQKDEILSRLRRSKIPITGFPVELINTYEIEKLFSDHPSLQSAQVYVTLNGRLCISVKQKNPILRVFSSAGQGFYIDDSGGFMPVSDKYTSHVLVANGSIPVSLDFKTDVSVFKWQGVNSAQGKTLQDLYKLGTFICTDKFWKAQIVQIHVTPVREYEVIPRVGQHVILLGKAEELETKFRNLKAVYEKGFNQYSWNAYKYINLSYKNQVICTKRDNYEH